MNAQFNHTIFTSQTHSTDPQFLGPETDPQAGGEGQCVNELDANGTELHRYFSVARGALISVRSNGVTLFRQVDDDWKVLSRKKLDVPHAQWGVLWVAVCKGWSCNPERVAAFLAVVERQERQA